MKVTAWRTGELACIRLTPITVSAYLPPSVPESVRVGSAASNWLSPICWLLFDHTLLVSYHGTHEQSQQVERLSHHTVPSG